VISEGNLKINFEKMQATGNDFILMSKDDLPDLDSVHLLARKLCRRHFGIGGDGLLAVGESENANCCMDMYNPGGTM